MAAGALAAERNQLRRQDAGADAVLISRALSSSDSSPSGKR
jgi:hypothetical protein